MNKVTQEYMNKIFPLVMLLITGGIAAAGATFAGLKALGYYSTVSWTPILIFIGLNIIYVTICIFFLCNAYEKNENGERNLKPKMLTAGKVFLFVLLGAQFNYIFYMIPTREFWAGIFLAATMGAFFLDVKFLVAVIIEELTSLIIVSFVKQNDVLPVKGENFIPEIGLRSICAFIILFSILLMCILIRKYLVNIKKNEIEENNARVQTVLGTAQELSEKLLEAGSALSEISSNETATAQDLATTGQELLANSNTLRTKASLSISNLNELKETGNQLSSNVEKVEQTSTAVMKKSTENAKVLDSLQKINKDVIKSMNETSDVASKLSEAVKGIDITLKLISDIAMSTNILSLNATIEAARAGEAGKGFAVVAHEVGSLASSTQESLAEIQNVMNNFQNNVTAMTTYVNENNSKLLLQNEYFSDVFKTMQEMNQLLEQSMSDINTMNEVHTRQADVIRKTVDINADIADSIEKENSEFTLITEMVGSNAKDALHMKKQVISINDMAEQIDALLK